MNDQSQIPTTPVVSVPADPDADEIAHEAKLASEAKLKTDATLAEERELGEARVATRNDFIAVLSHDLKNPLSSIQLNSMVILQEIPAGATGDKTRSRVKSIQRAISDMIRLIDSLLDAENIVAGKLPVEMAKTNVIKIVQDTASVLLPLAENSSIKLDIIVPEYPVEIMCDAARIGQVMSNLIANAIKFSDRNSHVKIEAEFVVDELVRISVTNSGKIVPENQREKIFERYTKSVVKTAPNSTNLLLQGHGLGLWIARWIVAQHYGKIWVEPWAEGNIFKFTLPIAPPVASSSTAIASP